MFVVGVVTWYEQGRLSTRDVAVSSNIAVTCHASHVSGQFKSLYVYNLNSLKHIYIVNLYDALYVSTYDQIFIDFLYSRSTV